MKEIFKKKNEIQSKALDTWRDKNYNSILAMCTGSGKSRCGVLASKFVVKDNKEANILLIVPTETLRDVNWKDEFKQWDGIDIYNNNIKRSCYVSINKIEDEEFDLVIMDKKNVHVKPL